MSFVSLLYSQTRYSSCFGRTIYLHKTFECLLQQNQDRKTDFFPDFWFIQPWRLLCLFLWQCRLPKRLKSIKMQGFSGHLLKWNQLPKGLEFLQLDTCYFDNNVRNRPSIQSLFKEFNVEKIDCHSLKKCHSFIKDHTRLRLFHKLFSTSFCWQEQMKK